MRFRIFYQELFAAPTCHLDITAKSLNQALARAYIMDVYVLSVKQLIRVKPC